MLHGFGDYFSRKMNNDLVIYCQMWEFDFTSLTTYTLHLVEMASMYVKVAYWHMTVGVITSKQGKDDQESRSHCQLDP